MSMWRTKGTNTELQQMVTAMKKRRRTSETIAKWAKILQRMEPSEEPDPEPINKPTGK